MDCSNNCPKNTHNGMKPTFCGDRIDSLEKFETSNGCGFGVKTLNAIDKGQVRVLGCIILLNIILCLLWLL